MTYVKIAVLLVIAGIIGGLWLINGQLRAERNALLIQTGQLKTAVEVQKQSIEAATRNARAWQTALLEYTARLDELVRVNEAAMDETRRLNDIFSKHDFALLARRRPGLIERRINSGTADRLRVLERITSGDLDKSGGAGGTSEPTSPAPSNSD